MPLISTRGSASSRGFGQFAAGQTQYNFLIMPDNQGTIQARNVLGAGGTGPYLKFGNISQNASSPCFLVLDGTSFLASGNYFSLNNGSTWTTYWDPVGIASGNAGTGLNAGGAYKSTGTKTVASLRTNVNFGYGSYGGFNYATSTGAMGSIEFSLGSGPTTVGLCYSPALNAFVTLTNYGGVRCYDASNFGLLGSSGFGSPGNYRLGVSFDGYPLFYSYAGFGTTYYLRKILTADLTSVSQLGTLNDSTVSQNWQSGILINSFTNQYMKVAGASGGGAKYFGVSSDAVTWTNYYIPPSLGENYTTKGDVIAVSTTELYANFTSVITDVGVQPVTYRSTDGGSSWSVWSYWSTATRNLQL